MGEDRVQPEKERTPGPDGAIRHPLNHAALYSRDNRYSPDNRRDGERDNRLDGVHGDQLDGEHGAGDHEAVVLVTMGRRWGRFRPNGQWIEGPLFEADPEMCLWVSFPRPKDHHRLSRILEISAER